MTTMTQRTSEAVRRQPLLWAGLALLAGFLIGWMLMGWVIWPVDFVNGDFSQLRPDLKQDYVRLVAAEYALNPNSDRAAARVRALGDEAPEVVEAALASSQGEDAIRVAQLKQVLEFTGGLAPVEPTDGQEQSLLDRFRVPLLVCSLLVVLLLGAAGVWYAWNSGLLKGLTGPRAAASGAGAPAGSADATLVPSARARARAAVSPPPAAGEMTLTDAAPRGAAAATLVGNPPIAQFMTTYVLGDDLYDDSFSIDAPDGSFLGECGMGISETIGVGDPKKVMAFEVWLFDKNDIRTVTKVLMSEHAYRDEALKSRLAAKGEPVLAQQGDVVSMETASLMVTARVVDMAYGGGALPTNSYFERLTIELAAFTKAG
jgi:hypothetical protein